MVGVPSERAEHTTTAETGTEPLRQTNTTTTDTDSGRSRSDKSSEEGILPRDKTIKTNKQTHRRHNIRN